MFEWLLTLTIMYFPLLCNTPLLLSTNRNYFIVKNLVKITPRGEHLFVVRYFPFL